MCNLERFIVRWIKAKCRIEYSMIPFIEKRKGMNFILSLPVTFLKKFPKPASLPHPHPWFLSFSLFFLLVSIPPLCLAWTPWSLNTTFSYKSPPSLWLGLLYYCPNIGLIQLFVFCRTAPRLYKQLCGLILSLVVLFFSISCRCSVLLDNLSIHPTFLPHNRYSNFCSTI